MEYNFFRASPVNRNNVRGQWRYENALRSNHLQLEDVVGDVRLVEAFVLLCVSLFYTDSVCYFSKLPLVTF
jgi:hypothetical protein